MPALSDRPLRSVLYLPASNARAIEKSRALDCDAVILDLEDAVAVDFKVDARVAAVAALAEGGFGDRLVAIRANGLDTQWGAEDFAAIAASRADAIVVPKVDTPAQAAAAVAAAGGKPVMAMIESPRAVIDCPAIAATPGLAALIAGTSDLGKELRARGDEGRSAFLYSLSAMLTAARANGLVALDGVHTDIPNLASLEATSIQGATMGFDGRTIIHPSHIEAVNRAYSPSAEEIEEARAFIAAYEEALSKGVGVATYKGKLIENLHVDNARRLLAFADAIATRR